MYILTSMSDTMSTKKNLRQRKGGGWAVVYYVPHELRKIVGKREIVRGLGTGPVRKKWSVSPELIMLTTGEYDESQTHPRI